MYYKGGVVHAVTAVPTGSGSLITDELGVETRKRRPACKKATKQVVRMLVWCEAYARVLKLNGTERNGTDRIPKKTERNQTRRYVFLPFFKIKWKHIERPVYGTENVLFNDAYCSFVVEHSLIERRSHAS